MIPINYIRSSSYGSHEMCEMKYFGEYVLGWKGASNIKADMGTMVHKVMEVLANLQLQYQKDQIRYKGLEDTHPETTFYDENMDCSFDYVPDDQEYLDHIIDTIYGYYIDKFDNHFWGSKEYKQYVKWCYKCLEFRGGRFHPFNQKIVSPEQHFDIEVKEDWAKYDFTLDGEQITGNLRLKGTIDLVIETENGAHEIIDYKTGRRLNWATGEEKTYEALQKDFQLRLYHYAHTILYPDAPNVLVTIYFINDGGPFTLCFGRSDIPDTLDMIRKKFERIKNTVIPKPNYTWKCKKFCQFGKETFEDKEGVKAIPARSDSRLSQVGDKMCMCDQMLYTLQHRPLEIVTDNLSSPNHDITFYQAPGGE